MKKDLLKLGIIGISEGNGHPYSWAAIFNGYDRYHMSYCPFPAIFEYLEKQSWPDDQLINANVTHIYTQNRHYSNDIANAANISNIVDDPSSMIGKVDGVLLARDDYQNHYNHALPFLEAGLPIYIDKPLANSVVEANKLFSLQKYESQIFTCSALRYMPLILNLKSDYKKISSIKAFTPKKWSTYAIHIIEPVLSLFPNVNRHYLTFENSVVDDEKVELSVRYNGVPITFFSSGNDNEKLRYEVEFTNGETLMLPYTDTFMSFKTSLKCFLDSVCLKKIMIPREETLTCMRIIEEGKSNE